MRLSVEGYTFLSARYTSSRLFNYRIYYTTIQMKMQVFLKNDEKGHCKRIREIKQENTEFGKSNDILMD